MVESNAVFSRSVSGAVHPIDEGLEGIETVVEIPDEYATFY
jgi:hypothetical protein